MMSNAILEQQLRILQGRIEAQIKSVEKHMEVESPACPSVYDLRYSDGKYVMPELLLAQSTVLSAMASLRKPVK